MALKGIRQLWRTVHCNGGIYRSIKAIFYRDDLKEGTLVGEDEYGNKYYENDRYFFGRNRWVNYDDNVGLNYDASQVPAEWYGWLHYRTDLPPHEDPSRPKYPWMYKHSENLTGTREQYVPYSTGRPKITPWKPGIYENQYNDNSFSDSEKSDMSPDSQDEDCLSKCDDNEEKSKTIKCENPENVFH